MRVMSIKERARNNRCGTRADAETGQIELT